MQKYSNSLCQQAFIALKKLSLKYDADWKHFGI